MVLSSPKLSATRGSRQAFFCKNLCGRASPDTGVPITILVQVMTTYNTIHAGISIYFDPASSFPELLFFFFIKAC